MRIISILLGLALTSFLGSCSSSDAQSSNANSTPVPPSTIATTFAYPLGGSGSLTEAKDGSDDWYDAQNFGENDHLGEDWNKNSGGNTDCGEPVYSIGTGHIVYAANGGPGWGNVVIIEHLLSDGTKLQSLYGHLQKIEKTSGEVELREKIGEVGNADGKYLCHLHLEVRRENCPNWGEPGPGYSSDRSGWIDPSEFIDSSRKVVAEKNILEFYKPQFTKDDLEPINSIDEFSRYDFGPVWSKSLKNEVLAFIGEDYQRITIQLKSVKKDGSKSQSYVVHGESVLKDQSRPFAGTFTITEVRRFKKMHWGVDDELKNTGMKVQGILTGDYELSAPDWGTFKGRLSALWFLDRADRIRADNIQIYADGFRNNQFIGFWTSASGTERQRSNWGDFRIPDSGDLDVGAGEFSPNEKYYKSGWESYRIK